MLAERLSCRQVLNLMVILGFMLNYMLRVNLTIAIIAMVIPSNYTHSNTSYISHECSGITHVVNGSATTLGTIVNKTAQSIHLKVRNKKKINFQKININTLKG